MNTLTIETTTGAATLSASALEIINDIVPLEVAFTTSGSASTASVVQVGYSDVSVGIRAGSQSGRMLASSGLWEVIDGKVRFALVLGADAQELIAASDSVSVYVEVTLRRNGLPDAKYFATGSASDTAASTAVYAHDRDPAAHLNIVRRTLAGDLTLTAADQQRQHIISDADREVTLPAEGAGQWSFLLCHAGASYNITVKRASGTTVGVLIPGSSLAVAWDGTGFGLC